MRTASASCSIVALMLAACTERTPTQVLVYFEAEPQARARTAWLRIRVHGPEGDVETRDVSMVGLDAAQWPVRLPLVPREGDASRTYEIVGEIEDEAGTLLGRQRAKSGYVDDSLRELRLLFEDSCLMMFCDAARTCVGGTCIGACMTPTAPGEVERSEPMPCPGDLDAGTDAEVTLPDAGPDDAATLPDAGPDDAATLLDDGGVPLERLLTAGLGHTCGRRDGTDPLRCWGSNGQGQLGDGSGASRSTRPGPLVMLPELATHAASGVFFSCARTVDGHVYCWGDNRHGQLGDGTIANRDVPVRALDLSDVQALGAGEWHACAIVAGRVRCWGSNAGGQLGDGTEDDRSVAGPEVPGLEDAVQVVAGVNFTCALRATGAVLCWGSNWTGQLGNSTRESSATPVEATGIEDAVQIAAGFQHACARHATGGVSCWGQRGVEVTQEDGRLCDGSLFGRRDTPFAIPDVEDATDLSLGRWHTCFVHASGAVSCCGANSRGQLGDGSFTARARPAWVSGLADAVAVKAGGEHTCAWNQAGGLLCWGANGSGELGIGTRDDETRPVEVLWP